MPRRPPRTSAVEAAQNFTRYLIAQSDTEDCILPKNGAFSPFHGFSRMLSDYADIRVGGASVDGVSRAGLNKMVGMNFSEGMRKPSRNGNPGELSSAAAHRLARHFLKARWRYDACVHACMYACVILWESMPSYLQKTCVCCAWQRRTI